MNSPARHLHAADGTRIAYRVRGEGPPVVLVNGLSAPDHFWEPLRRRWLAGHRVIDFDHKGHGDSEGARSERGCAIEALVDDVQRVMDAAEVERAVLVGFSMGCQVSVEAWRHMPERIAGLACLLGPAGRIFDIALRPVAGPTIQRLLRHLPAPLLSPAFGAAHRAARLPGAVMLGRLARLYGRAPAADMRGYVEHFGRLDPRTIANMALHAGEHDARDVLPSIDVPTLVVAGDRDVFAPSRTVGVPMHAAIPGAELLRIVDGTHLAVLEHHEVIGHAVDRLLTTVWEA